MENESDCEAGGECIIDEEHRTEDEEAVFRRVYDYLTEKKYQLQMERQKMSSEQSGRRHRGTVELHLLFMTKHVLKSCCHDLSGQFSIVHCLCKLD